LLYAFFIMAIAAKFKRRIKITKKRKKKKKKKTLKNKRNYYCFKKVHPECFCTALLAFLSRRKKRKKKYS